MYYSFKEKNTKLNNKVYKYYTLSMTYIEKGNSTYGQSNIMQHMLQKLQCTLVVRKLDNLLQSSCFRNSVLIISNIYSSLYVMFMFSLRGRSRMLV